MRGRRRCLGFIQQQARARKYPAVAGNIKAAKVLLRKAMKGQPVSAKVTLDAEQWRVADAGASARQPVPEQQDHRRIQYRLRPMWGLKSVETAEVVIGGIDPVELGGRTATIPEIWQAAPASQSESR